MNVAAAAAVRTVRLPPVASRKWLSACEEWLHQQKAQPRAPRRAEA